MAWTLARRARDPNLSPPLGLGTRPSRVSHLSDQAAQGRGAPTTTPLPPVGPAPCQAPSTQKLSPVRPRRQHFTPCSGGKRLRGAVQTGAGVRPPGRGCRELALRGQEGLTRRVGAVSTENSTWTPPCLPQLSRAAQAPAPAPRVPVRGTGGRASKAARVVGLCCCSFACPLPPRGFSCEPWPRPRRQGGQITRKEWALEPTVGPRGCPVPPGRGCPPRRATGRSPAPRASAGSSAEATPSRDETKDGVGRSPGRRAWRRGQGGHALPVTPCRPARSPRGSLSGWERGCPSQANARMPLGCHGNCRSAQASRIDSG